MAGGSIDNIITRSPKVGKQARELKKIVTKPPKKEKWNIRQ